MADEKKAVVKPRDRKLGDEWIDWTGDPSECEAAIREGKGKFVLFAFLLYVFTSAGVIMVLYMILPRLSQFSRVLPAVALALTGVGVGGTFVWFLLFVFTMLFERNLLPGGGKLGAVISFFGPKVIWLGQRFGISRDHMGSSFVKVCNCLIKVGGKTSGEGEVLVLLPRCLSKEIRPKVLEVCRRYGCRVETVSGGEAARASVSRVRPRGIVGVACERDLVSGLKDVMPSFPAVGVANVREQGPCKNTTLDLGELEEAIRIFVGEKEVPPEED